MRKFFISAAFVACFALQKGNAQTVNGIKLSELQAEYIEARYIGQIFSSKVHIALQYGQKISPSKNLYVRNDDGTEMEFNSIIDFINQMKDYNYELFQVYIYKITKSDVEKYYVLRKKR